MSRRLWPWLALVAVGVVALGPAVWSPGRMFIGSDYLDAYGTQWFFWWTEHALSTHQPLDHSPLLFFPWGKEIFRHTGANLLDSLLALPLRWLFGPILGTNIWVALLLGTNAWGGERLAAAAGAGRSGRLLGATLGLLNPFALVEINMGRPTQGMLIFPSLAMATMIAPPTWRRGLFGGLWLALSGYTYWYYGLLGALVGGIAVAVRLITGPDQWRELCRLGIVAAVSVALVMPAAWPMFSHVSAGDVPGLLALSDVPGVLGRIRLQTVEGDAQGLFVLAGSGRVGALLDVDGLRFSPGPRELLFTHALIALAGLGWAWRRGRLALSWLIGLGLIATGPALVVGTHFIGDPVFIWFFEHVDLLRRWWWPGRALGLALLALIPVAALLLARLPERARAPAALGVALSVLVELLWGGVLPMDAWSGQVSPGIHCLARAPEGAVIELPFRLGQRPLYHQTIHHKPMLNGMLVTKTAFIPPEAVKLWRENSFVDLVIQLGDRHFGQHLRYDPEDRVALETLGYRYLVFRKEGFLRPRTRSGETTMESDWGRARRNLRDDLGLPAWEDDELAIYTLDGTPLDCGG